MKYNFDPNLPIYLQVIEEIKRDIFNERYLPGSKIPSVRELALQYGVNPNTIQKSLTELEREGLLRSERAVGRYVTDDTNSINKAQKEVSDGVVDNFIKEMKALGFSITQIVSMINERNR